ncbi:MAG: transglycosylase domain-containing protein [bacterium]|nr:transglycosylase domain-containing protein [bacterium]
MQDFKKAFSSRRTKVDKKGNKEKVELTAKQKILTVIAVLLSVFFGLFLVGIVVVIIVFAWFARDLPSPDQLKERSVDQATKIMDRSGKTLYSVYDTQNRDLVTLDKIPKNLINATIDTEDKDFYEHQGFAVEGYFRIIYDLVRYRKLIGASSITQQLVKNTLVGGDRTPTRKLRELILAIQVDKRFTKDEVLQMYLNEIPYGGTTYGVEAAAQSYFGKHVNELNLTESAILAGLPQSPTYYSPFGEYPESFKDRSKYVLRRMKEQGHITKEQQQASIAELDAVKFADQKIDIEAPHFTLYVKDLMEEKYGKEVVAQGGLRIYTSLDLELQNKVQNIVRTEVEKLAKAKVGNGAAVVINPKTGEILAMVGSKDYFAKDYDGQVNVTTRPRQPGSATKPITYAVGFTKGYTPATMWVDVQTAFDAGPGQEPYKPVNYDGKYRGPVQTRTALGSSLNITAVKALATNGIKDTMKVAYDMGLNNWEPTTQAMQNVGLSLTLGGRETSLLDLASAYAVFANQGVKQELVSVIKVTDAKGKVLDEFHPSTGKQILKPEITYLISDILSDDNARIPAFGPRSLLYIAGKHVAAKTGTTDEKRDNWAFGYTPSYVVGAWVGNNDNTKMDNSIASGVTGATPIWNKIIHQLIDNKPDEWYTKPGEIVGPIAVDSKTGMKPGNGTTATRPEIFIKGTEPQPNDITYQNVRVCKGTNEVEHDGCEAEDKQFAILTDPYLKLFSKPGVCAGDCPSGGAFSGFSSIGGNPKDAPDINIRDIPDQANVPFTFNVTADANPKNGAQVTNMKIYLDDYNQVGSSNTGTVGTQINFKPEQAGVHKIRIEATDNKNVTSTKEITVNVR